MIGSYTKSHITLKRDVQVYPISLADNITGTSECVSLSEDAGELFLCRDIS